MHEPAGVVEILVQNPQNTPYSEVQNTPPNENCQSPNPRVSEYPPNENCQRVQIREFQNTLPQMKNVREFQNTPLPPKIGKTSDFKLQNSLATREIVCGD